MITRVRKSAAYHSMLKKLTYFIKEEYGMRPAMWKITDKDTGVWDGKLRLRKELAPFISENGAGFYLLQPVFTVKSKTCVEGKIKEFECDRA